ncbi:MAG: SPOR domain-containing protein [candidate division WOR-3 bacterium]
MLKKLIILVLFSSLIFAGCTKKAKTTQPTQQPSVVIVEEEPKVQQPQLEIVEEKPAETPITQQTKVSEYKVQIFATYDEAKAYKVRDEAKTKFAEDVYVEYIPPYYKVRIGHFKTKEDADRFRDLVKDKGYSDAFTVIP